MKKLSIVIGIVLAALVALVVSKRTASLPYEEWTPVQPS